MLTRELSEGHVLKLKSRRLMLSEGQEWQLRSRLLELQPKLLYVVQGLKRKLRLRTRYAVRESLLKFRRKGLQLKMLHDEKESQLRLLLTTSVGSA